MANFEDKHRDGAGGRICGRWSTHGIIPGPHQTLTLKKRDSNCHRWDVHCLKSRLQTRQWLRNGIDKLTRQSGRPHTPSLLRHPTQNTKGTNDKVYSKSSVLGEFRYVRLCSSRLFGKVTISMTSGPVWLDQHYQRCRNWHMGNPMLSGLNYLFPAFRNTIYGDSALKNHSTL